MHRLESALNLIEKKLGMDELMPIQYFFFRFYLTRCLHVRKAVKHCQRK